MPRQQQCPRVESDVDIGEIRVFVVLERAQQHRVVARLESQNHAHKIFDALDGSWQLRNLLVAGGDRQPDFGGEFAREFLEVDEILA